MESKTPVLEHDNQPSQEVETLDRVATKEDIAAAVHPQMTERQFRELRRVYFTVRHNVVHPCGHKLDALNQPRFNCEHCWFGWFETHPDLVTTADRAFQEQGKPFLSKMRGDKFTKMFCRYMRTKLELQKETECLKQQEKDTADSLSPDEAAENAVEIISGGVNVIAEI